jgi:hypothetical protein
MPSSIYKGNGFADHAPWLAARRSARSSQTMVVGFAKESFGNQSCRLVNAKETETGESHLGIPMQINCRADYLRDAMANDGPISWRFVREDRRCCAIAAVEVQ